MNRLLLLRENTYICGIHFKISGVVVVDKNHITDCGKSLLLNSQRISKTDRIRMSFYIYHTAANVDFTLSYKKKKNEHQRRRAKNDIILLYDRKLQCFIYYMRNIQKRCFRVDFILNILALFADIISLFIHRNR